MVGRGSGGWFTVCLHESVLQLSEHELRTELARWVDAKILIPAADHGSIRASHPYALFAFVPASVGSRANQLARSRFVENVLTEPIPHRELKAALGRAGETLCKGQQVKVSAGPLAGLEGVVTRCTARSVQIRVTLLSGSRSIWVRREEVIEDD